MKKLAIRSAATVLAALLWCMHVADNEAQEHEEWAENSSTDEIQFTSSGLLGRTLVIAESAPADCDSYLDQITHDNKIRAKVHRGGFTKVSCGGETRDLR